MAFSLCYIVFIDLFLDDMVVDTKKTRVEMAMLGLARWPWPCGHYARRLVDYICSFFRNSDLYINEPQTMRISYTCFSLAKHASWNFSQTCAAMHVSCNAWPTHIYIATFVSKHVFLHVFKAFDHVRKKHAMILWHLFGSFVLLAFQILNLCYACNFPWSVWACQFFGKRFNKTTTLMST